MSADTVLSKDELWNLSCTVTSSQTGLDRHSVLQGEGRNENEAEEDTPTDTERGGVFDEAELRNHRLMLFGAFRDP
ncbi:uncharacterized protein I303_102593 [Kwoniella dejecticola CBS 10117]|uniref:Uncharacterized protein n=1 Tax=Kwoniella dejecticola CBS 10117 TaxID=1296121 RepID=A0AAJ8KLV8_9TREE